MRGGHDVADRRRELLTEAIHTVRSLDNDQHPALFELLMKSALLEVDVSHKRGVQLMEQAVELGGAVFGPDDIRIAEALTYLGYFYAPSAHSASDSKSTDDVATAEDYYQQALRIFQKQENPAAHEGFGAVADYLKILFEVDGQTQKAAEMDKYIDGIYEEQEKLIQEKKEEAF